MGMRARRRPRVRGVEADGEVRAHRLASELLQRGQDAHRREGELARGHREASLVHEDPQRGHGGVVVEQRLPHSHDHDVPGERVLLATVGVGGRGGVVVHHRRHLAEDLPGLQVALVPGDTGQAEGALQGAAGLGRDADRPAVTLGDVDRLDGGPAVEAEEVLAGPVERQGALGDLRPSQAEALLEGGAESLREVGHRAHLPHPPLVQPAEHLTGPEGRSPELAGERGEVVTAHAEEVGAAHPAMIHRGSPGLRCTIRGR